MLEQETFIDEEFLPHPIPVHQAKDSEPLDEQIEQVRDFHLIDNRLL